MGKLRELNKLKPYDSQGDAILIVNSPLYITAGPGSGKTWVLLWRILNLIGFHDFKTENIFLSTFREKAAHQLHDGLRNLLRYATNANGKTYDLSKMYVGKVHSLCNWIINDQRRFLQDYRASPSPRLINELNQYFRVAKMQNWQALGSVLELNEVVEQNSEINLIMGSSRTSKHNAVTG